MKRPRAGPSAAAAPRKKYCCGVGGCGYGGLSYPRDLRRHEFLAHGVRTEVENREGGVTAEISFGGVVGAYEVCSRGIVLRCENEGDDGERCANPTGVTGLSGRARCETCAPGESTCCIECGTGHLTHPLCRLRHQFLAHGEEKPLDTTIQGFVVLKGVYVGDALGAYVIKEDRRFQHTVRVLKCEGRDGKCNGIAGRNKARDKAMCVDCDPLAVPRHLLVQAKSNQSQRAKWQGGGVPEDFHDLIPAQGILIKWENSKICVHCGRATVLIADVGLNSAASLDRKEGKHANYTDPSISCFPCNRLMGAFDKAVVTYAVATGSMPLHEGQREEEDYLAYHASSLNRSRASDLKQARYRELPNWETLRQELDVKVTASDLEIKTVDATTRQKYCHCTRPDCPLRPSFDRVDSDLPHVLSNLKTELVCTNLMKGSMPDSDFRLILEAFRGNHKALNGTEPPQLTGWFTPAPTTKTCSRCEEHMPLDRFPKDTKNPDGKSHRCNACNRTCVRANKLALRKTNH